MFQAASRIRLRSGSKPARPYICRLIILMRLTLPSTAAGAVRHGQAVDDGCVVALQSGGEGVQWGWVVGADLFDPSVELFAVKTGHHLGESRDVFASGGQVRAVGEYQFELDLLIGAAAVGMAQHPRGYLADLRRPHRDSRGTSSGRNGWRWSRTVP